MKWGNSASWAQNRLLSIPLTPPLSSRAAEGSPWIFQNSTVYISPCQFHEHESTARLHLPWTWPAFTQVGHRPVKKGLFLEARASNDSVLESIYGVLFSDFIGSAFVWWLTAVTRFARTIISRAHLAVTLLWLPYHVKKLVRIETFL